MGYGVALINSGSITRISRVSVDGRTRICVLP
jgi:hypothetical protein